MVIGHRDTSPDLNGNGRIDPQEYIKACPCFDVKKWLEQGREKLLLLLAILIILLLLWACRSGRKMQPSDLTTVFVADSAYGRRVTMRKTCQTTQTEKEVERTSTDSMKEDEARH